MRNTRKSIKAIVSTAHANAAALIAPCSSSIVCVFVRTLQKDLSRTYALYKSDRSLIYVAAPNNKAALGSLFWEKLNLETRVRSRQPQSAILDCIEQETLGGNKLFRHR